MVLSDKKKMILKGILIGVLSAIIVIAAGVSGYSYWLLNQDEIYPSVYIEDLYVSGKTMDEAKKELKEHMKPSLQEKELVLILDDEEWVFTAEDFGYRYDYEVAVEQAMALGRSENPVRNLIKIHQMKEQPKKIILNDHFDDGLVLEVLRDIDDQVYIEGEPATIRRTSGDFEITPEKAGRVLKRDDLEQKIIQAIGDELSATIEIPTGEVAVYPTKEDLEAITDVIGEYSTTFNREDSGRTENLRRGADSISETLILPGEAFSFNETTGPRVESAGYQEAPVIIRGELVPGIGGGICQVSSTLYNAVVRADLKVVERRNHSLPVSYVNLGHDATVAYGAIDLKFENNQDYPVFLESYIAGNQLHVRIFGKKIDEDQTIYLTSRVAEVIEPEIEIKEDPEMYEGEEVVEQEPKNGYRVVAYKIYQEDGREIKREEISRDYYQPVQGITIRGTKPKMPFHDYLQEFYGEQHAETEEREEALLN